MPLYAMPTFDIVGQVKQGSNGADWPWKPKGCRMLGLDEYDKHGAKRHAGALPGKHYAAAMEDIGDDAN